VQDESFLSKFKGFTADSDENTIDNVTAATYSSKGMKAAVRKAVDLYAEYKEEIFNG
jgi:electron transport complex protein RnfG